MFIRIATLLLLAASLAPAHLDSLIRPKEGMAYYAGSPLLVEWTIGNNHNSIDVHLSTDDKTWTTLAKDLAKTVTRFNWTLPSQTFERARIRVCQKSGPQGCTDADSLSNPSDGPLYTLVSGRFRIVTAPTSLGLPAAPRLESRLLADGIPGLGIARADGWRDLRGRRMALPARLRR